MEKNKNIETKIIEVLDRIRPYLENDGGNLEYIKFEEGIVYIKLLGACAGCSMIDITLKDGIEEIIISEIPEVKEVILSKRLVDAPCCLSSGEGLSFEMERVLQQDGNLHKRTIVWFPC